MIMIPETQVEFSIEWYRYYAHKYGKEKVWMHQDENKINYIVVETEDENKPYDVSKQLPSSESLSASELESVPF